MPYDELFLAQATTFRDYQARRDASYRQTLKELVANRTVEGDIQPNSLEGGAILASLGEWDPKQACWDESKGQPIDCWRESNPWQGRVDIYNPTPPGSMLTSVLNKSTALPTSILSEPGSFDHAVMGYNPSALPYRSDVMASAGVPVSAANYYTPLRPLMDPYPTTDIMTWSRDAWRPPADPNVDMWNEESPSEPPICTGSRSACVFDRRCHQSNWLIVSSPRFRSR
jgi:hypothetical protein